MRYSIGIAVGARSLVVVKFHSSIGDGPIISALGVMITIKALSVVISVISRVASILLHKVNHEFIMQKKEYVHLHVAKVLRVLLQGVPSVHVSVGSDSPARARWAGAHNMHVAACLTLVLVMETKALCGRPGPCME